MEFKLSSLDQTVYFIVSQSETVALLKRETSLEIKDPTPFIVANGLKHKEKNLIEWDNGKYFESLERAVINFIEQKSVDEKFQKRDSDSDGIPDNIDSEYTTPSEYYQYKKISSSELEELSINYVIVSTATSNENEHLIKFRKEDEAFISQILQNHKLTPTK